jgi:hypothetical protein
VALGPGVGALDGSAEDDDDVILARLQGFAGANCCASSMVCWSALLGARGVDVLGGARFSVASSRLGTSNTEGEGL